MEVGAMPDTPEPTEVVDEARISAALDAEPSDAGTPESDLELGDAGMEALRKEREARKKMEKENSELRKYREERSKTQKELSELRKWREEQEAASLSKEEKTAKELEDLRSKAATAAEKVRRANLISALGDQGLIGGKAKAAARLIDGVDFDDNDEPTNLDDALKAARATYGEDMFTAAKADPTALPDTHPGARTEKPSDEDKLLAASRARMGHRT